MVEFVFNFDDISSELIVLLVMFFNLLVNGFMGILVGYVIEFFFYYLGEVIDVMIMWIDKLICIIEELMMVI